MAWRVGGRAVSGGVLQRARPSDLKGPDLRERNSCGQEGRGMLDIAPIPFLATCSSWPTSKRPSEDNSAYGLYLKRAFRHSFHMLLAHLHCAYENVTDYCPAISWPLSWRDKWFLLSACAYENPAQTLRCWRDDISRSKAIYLLAPFLKGSVCRKCGMHALWLSPRLDFSCGNESCNDPSRIFDGCESQSFPHRILHRDVLPYRYRFSISYGEV